MQKAVKTLASAQPEAEMGSDLHLKMGFRGKLLQKELKTTIMF